MTVEQLAEGTPLPALKKCSKCRSPHTREGRYCSNCHAAYMREWRKINKMGEGQRRRDAARSYANQHKKRGDLIQQPCCVCSDPDTQMHHPDHELPLIVAWMCRECHLTWHAFWRFTAIRTWNKWRSDQENVRRETKSETESANVGATRR